MTLRLTPRWALFLALATCLTIAPGALAASAGWGGAKTNVQEACKNQVLVQPFLRFLDPGYYVFAPNGGFESGSTGWGLTGSAKVASGNEPYAVHAASDRFSLSLGAGATATTPALCVGALHPYSRLFVNGGLGALMKVEILYVDGGGVQRTLLLPPLAGLGSWQLSPPLVATSTVSALTSSLGTTDESGRRLTAVAYRFTALSGSWRLDDLYVDPFKFG